MYVSVLLHQNENQRYKMYYTIFKENVKRKEWVTCSVDYSCSEKINKVFGMNRYVIGKDNRSYAFGVEQEDAEDEF